MNQYQFLKTLPRPLSSFDLIEKKIAEDVQAGALPFARLNGEILHTTPAGRNYMEESIKIEIEDVETQIFNESAQELEIEIFPMEEKPKYSRDYAWVLFKKFVQENDCEPKLSGEFPLEVLLARWKQLMIAARYEFPD